MLRSVDFYVPPVLHFRSEFNVSAYSRINFNLACSSPDRRARNKSAQTLSEPVGRCQPSPVSAALLLVSNEASSEGHIPHIPLV